MTIKIGINGFGRIGRNLFRALSKDPEFAGMEVVAINDLTDIPTLAHLLKYDSIMGIYASEVTATEEGIVVDGRPIAVTRHRSPADIPWQRSGVEYVAECTGFFSNLDAAQVHLNGGASKVVISAPAKGGVKTLVMGVN